MHAVRYSGEMVADPGPERSSLRERKRHRTRQALVDAAMDLFTRQGYDGTTIAQIAAAAEVGTRTFFSYFATKEDLLFPGGDARIQAVVDAIATRRPDDRPTDVLLRAIADVAAVDADLTSPLAALRLHLMNTVPAVQGRALQLQLDAQHHIARHLHKAYPHNLDELSAAALVGAFVGAVTAALQVLLTDPDNRTDRAHLATQLHRATSAALQHWTNPPAS